MWSRQPARRKRRGADSAVTFDRIHQRESSLDLELTVIQSVDRANGGPPQGRPSP